MNFLWRTLRGRLDASILKLPAYRNSCRTPFVILSYARTGSTYLVDRLDAHPDISCWGELFHQHSLRHPPLLKMAPGWWSSPEACHQNPLRVFSLIYRLPAGTPVVGFKLMKHHNARIYEMLLHRPDIKIILLCRRNLFRQYLSNLLSQQSTIYSARDAGILEKHRASSAEGVRMDPEGYRSWAGVRRRSLERMRKQFKSGGLNWMELNYEDITGPEQLQAFNRIADLLQVAPFPAVAESALSRQNPDPARDLVRNFEEVASAFRGTPDEWMLES